MQIEIDESKVLLSNEHGEYHLSLEEYNQLGKEKAIEKALEDIKKKNKAEFFGTTINFEQARQLGFCEYGIEDFCKRLELDINASYTIKELSNRLTLEAFKEYPQECLKLFGKGIIEKFGGVIGLLENNKEDSSIFYLVVDNFVEDEILHKFSVKVAYYSLMNYEKEYPNDNRPRLAIEAKEKFIKGAITDEELAAAESAARSAAWSAAESAAWSAAWSAESAAESAARSAAWSAAESAAWSAAWSAAESAAWSAVWSAAYKHFSEELLKLIKEV